MEWVVVVALAALVGAFLFVARDVVKHDSK